MELPFTREAFLDVLKDYNHFVWPIQIGFYLLAFITLNLILKKKYNSAKRITLILSFLWLWMGLVYHLIFFTAINKAAYGFGTIFIIQGTLLVYFGIIKSRLSFRFSKNVYTVLGGILIGFALLIYPILGYFLGHVYPYSPTFGLPCPTTIFTFGIFLMADKKFPLALLIIPLIWSVIGFTAAFSLGLTEDVALLVSGILAVTMVMIRNREMVQHLKPIKLTP